MNYKYQMLTLNFDVTRRCNLQCKFCARGEPQNEDITSEVVDATLDQLGDAYILGLRLGGGESFLAPNMIEYIVDGIIRRRLAVYCLVVFTNGTIRDPKVAAALVRFAEYLESRPDIVKETAFIEHSTTFYDVFDNRIGIIISEDYHDVPESVRRDTIAYYSGLHKLISIDTQEHSRKKGVKTIIKLEGNALKNIRELVGDTLGDPYSVSGVDNRFCFVEWLDNDVRLIKKSVSISTDGSVFIGCFLPYDHIGSESELNILSGESLFDWIEQYCWRHPLPRGAKEVREHYEALCICNEHEIKVPAAPYMIMKECVAYIDFLEKQCLRLHDLHPQLSPASIQVGAFALLFNELQAMGHTKSRLQETLAVLYGPDLPGKGTRFLLLSEVGREHIIRSLDSTGSMTAI